MSSLIFCLFVLEAGFLIFPSFTSEANNARDFVFFLVFPSVVVVGVCDALDFLFFLTTKSKLEGDGSKQTAKAGEVETTVKYCG